MQRGKELGGRYRLEGLLGRGGMGEVWRATDLRLRRPVAVKILALSDDTDAEDIARFRREAETTAALNHPGITMVFDIDEHRDADEQSLFLVMELMNGRDLRKLLGAYPNGLPVEQVTDLAVQIADALGAAHENGVVHRDIKPANLFLLDNGRTKICDFGIARLADATQLTKTGAFFGTPLYMAPEQIRGEHVDHRTDLYAFGCVLYELLTGATWVTADITVTILYQHLNQQPVPPKSSHPHIPDHLNTLILELLAKQPGDRPQDAASVAARLREPSSAAARRGPDATANAAAPHSAVPPALPPLLPADHARADVPGTPRRFGRRSVILGGLGAAAAAGLGGVAWLTSEAGSTSQATTPRATPRVARRPTLLATLTGHTDDVFAVAFSPDGQTLATGSNDGTCRLWNPATGHTVATFTGDGRAVTSVAFSRDGRTLAAAADSGVNARLWDVTTGRTTATFKDDGARVGWPVAFSPDGQTLATGSDDGTTRLWDVATGRLTAILTGHTDLVWSLMFSHDGATLATGSRDLTARLWDVATHRARAKLTGHTDDVFSVAFNRDGTTLATGSKDGTTRLWDTTTEETIATLTTKRGDGDHAVESVAFRPADTSLATSDNDGVVRFWNPATGHTTATFQAHADQIEMVAFSRTGTTLATCSKDNTARVWRLA